MSDQCKICLDPMRFDIEKAMEVPRSDSAVSRKFKLSRATVTKHRAHIVHKSAVDIPQVADSSEISRLKASAQRILDTAKDDKVRLAAVQRLESLHGLELRIHQEAQGTSSLTSDPAFQRVAAAMASCLCDACFAKVASLTEDSIGTALSHANASAPVGGIPALED